MRDRSDLAALRARFLSFRLERALSRLASPISLLNTGAHPDDEHSALLAWLRFGRGLWVATLSSTRGQGGQNRIGSERGDLLGLIRSREMEHAAQVLDADHYWLDRGPGDAMSDFGFSKSGSDTLRRWGGRDQVIDRMVRIYRQHRPDIMLPTFLDVPGQHGHHRAMTEAALAALPLAADPSYRTDDLTPWQVAKAYLPAWSGGGATYDDELPPPAATLHLAANGTEPLTGATWAQIGEASRLCHASQDMGDPSAVVGASWPLHLLGGGPETDILDGLPRSYGALPNAPNGLVTLDKLFATLPSLRGAALVAALEQADILLSTARDLASPGFVAAHGHRLSRLKTALDQAMFLALELLPLHLQEDDGVIRALPTLSPAVSLTLTSPPGYEVVVEDGEIHITAAQDAAPLSGFQPGWDRFGANGNFHGMLEMTHNARYYRTALGFETQPVILPALAADFVCPDLFYRCGAGDRQWPMPLPEGAELRLPAGFSLQDQSLKADASLQPGLYWLDLLHQGRPILGTRSGHLASGEAVHLTQPLRNRLLALDLQLPKGRVGYLAGTDDLGPAMRAMGLNVTELSAAPTAADLAGLDSLLLGVVALDRHADLAATLPLVADWVRAGGNLVSFYQRPDQGWPSEGLGLDPLRIGQPSLRWRVTDPEAEVTLLQPSHAIFTSPNQITAEDWQGWNKERGLYFAADWGGGYVPLLAMGDPGEQPLQGSLLSGDFGAGRHSHVSLTLHHQIAQMVPGAVRLLANLLQPR